MKFLEEWAWPKDQMIKLWWAMGNGSWTGSETKSLGGAWTLWVLLDMTVICCVCCWDWFCSETLMCCFVFSFRREDFGDVSTLVVCLHHSVAGDHQKHLLNYFVVIISSDILCSVGDILATAFCYRLRLSDSSSSRLVPKCYPLSVYKVERRYLSLYWHRIALFFTTTGTGYCVGPAWYF